MSFSKLHCMSKELMSPAVFHKIGKGGIFDSEHFSLIKYVLLY